MIDVQRAGDEGGDGAYQVTISVRGPGARSVLRTLTDARFALLRAATDGGLALEHDLAPAGPRQEPAFAELIDELFEELGTPAPR